MVAACDRRPAPSVRLFARDGFAMGTFVEMKIAARDSTAAAVALDAAFRELARVEQLSTVHDSTSELSRVNAAAGSDAPVPVGSDLDAILNFAADVAERSGGAFDPTVGPLLRLWGFPEHPALPDSSAIRRTLALVGHDKLTRVESASPAWRLGVRGMSLDLGGIACGYGIDRAAEALQRLSPDFLINVGGDIVVGGTKPDSAAWSVAIQHPRDPSKLLMTLHLRGPRGVSTSGDYEHFVLHEGRRLHHVLDPETGYPAPGVCSVTVVAPDGARADAESKPAFVLGIDRGLQWLEEDPDLEGVIVFEEPSGTLLVRETSGIAALRAPAPEANDRDASSR